ncbi:MAG: hypothetical protein ACRDYA_15885 [Egibacteraceae bacterium]
MADRPGVKALAKARSCAPGGVLEELSARLGALDSQPVETHPEVLEQLHRAIVEELEALAASTKSPPRP